MKNLEYQKDICPICGSSYTLFKGPKEEWKNGECNCYLQNKLFLDYRMANLPYEYFSKDLSDYEFKENTKDKKFYCELKKFIELLDGVYETGSCIYLHNGIPSTGKTFFAISILKEAYRKKYSIFYIPFVKVYSEVLNGNKDIFSTIDKKDFLVIDSVDKKLNKDFLTDIKLLNYFESFLRERCKPIIFTGSTSLSSPEYNVLTVIKQSLKNKIYELHIDSDLQYECSNYWDTIVHSQKKIFK